MRPFARIAAAALVVSALSACAYKPLKAPCAADEGGPVAAYSSLVGPSPAESPSADRCGPMRPI